MPYDYPYMMQNIFLYRYYLFIGNVSFLIQKYSLILKLSNSYVFFLQEHGFPYGIHDIAPLTERSNEGVANMKSHILPNNRLT